MKKTAKILVAILIASLLVGALGVLAFAKEPVSGTAPKTGLVKTTQLANGNYFYLDDIVGGSGSYTVGEETVNYGYIRVDSIDELDDLIAGKVPAAAGAKVYSNGGAYLNITGGDLAGAYGYKGVDGKAVSDYDYIVFSIAIANDGKLAPIKLHGKAQTLKDDGTNGSDAFLGGFSFDDNGVLAQNTAIKLDTTPYAWNLLTLIAENSTGVMKLYVNDKYAAQIDPVGAGLHLRGFQSIRIEVTPTALYNNQGTEDTADDVKTLTNGGNPVGAGFLYANATATACVSAEDVGLLFNGTYTNISDVYANGTKVIDVPTVTDLPTRRPVATIGDEVFYSINEAVNYYYLYGTNTTIIKLMRNVDETVEIYAPIKFNCNIDGDSVNRYTLNASFDQSLLVRNDSQSGYVIFSARDNSKTYGKITFSLNGETVGFRWGEVGTTVKAPAEAVDLGGKRVVGWTLTEGNVVALGGDATVTDGAVYTAVLAEYAFKATVDGAVTYYDSTDAVIGVLNAATKNNVVLDVYKDVTITKNTAQMHIQAKTHTINLYGADFAYKYSGCKLYQIDSGTVINFNGFADKDGVKPTVSAEGNQLCGTYAYVNFSNVNIYKPSTVGNYLIDLAGGTTTFKGCTFNSDATPKVPFLSVRNNNSLVLDGCTVSCPAAFGFSNGTHNVTLSDTALTAAGAFVVSGSGNKLFAFSGNNILAGATSPIEISAAATVSLTVSGEILMDSNYPEIVSRVPSGKVLLGLANGQFKVTDAANAVTITVKVGDNTETLYFEKGAQFSYNVPSGGAVIDGVAYCLTFLGWKDEAGNPVTPSTEQNATYVADLKTEPATLAVYRTDGTISYATTETTVPAKVIENGYTTELYADMTFTFDGTEYNLGVPVVIELNGHNLTKAGYRFNVTKGFTIQSTSENRPTVYNGGVSLCFGSGNITFKNFRCEMTGTQRHHVDFRSAAATNTVDFDGVEFIGGNTVLIFGQTATGGQIYIKDCYFGCEYAFSVGAHATYPPKYMQFTLEVDGCTFDTTNPSIVTGKLPAGEEANPTCITFNISDSSFKSDVYMSQAEYAKGVVVFNFTDCQLADLPDAKHPEGWATFNYGEQILIETTDAELPYKMVNAADAPKTLANLTLYTDFVLNFYLPATATNITVNGAAAEGTEFDGMVKVACDRVSALEVGNTVTVAYECTAGGYTVAMSATYSVADYAKAILEGEYDAQAKALVANAVRYAASVFTYTNTQPAENVAALLTLAGYTENVGALNAVPASTADYSALAEYVESVQLSLGATLKYVVNFKAGFEGTVTVNGTAIEVKGSEYIVLRASDFADGLTLTVNGVTGTYDLAAYYAGIKGTDAALDALLVALYNYSAQAKAYVEQ